MASKVLAIDDSPDIQLLLRARLRNMDIELECVSSGSTGLARAVETLPDLILLNVNMPDTTGFDVCRTLKATPATHNIPVIFLTGAADVDQKVLGFDVGAMDYIEKPFDAAELKARIRAALRTKRYQDMLAQRAMLDGLTGLWNRADFDLRLQEEFDSAIRYGRPMALIMMDIDQFKTINDHHGHPFGDEVLQAIGEVLSSNARSSDRACRYGGEEFAVILRETSLDGAQIVAERLRAQVQGLTFFSHGQPVPVTASFGVGASELCRTPEATTAAWLLKGTDEALYQSKQNGRNRVTCASPS